MFGLIKKIFIYLSYKVLFVKQSEMHDSTQEFCCYPFAIKLDRCVGSCNTLNDLSNKLRAPIKTRFKSKHFKQDYRNESIENINQKANIE